MAIKNKIKGRLMLVLLVLVCAGPIIFSWLLLKNADNISFADASHGELITPVIALPGKSLLSYTGGSERPVLRGKWFLLYWAGEYCDDDCMLRLEHIERIRQAMGKDSHRLQPVLFSTATLPAGLSYGGEDELWLWQAVPGQDELLAIAAADSRIGRKGYYVIDPEGNLLISYSVEVNPVGIIKDIRRLMRASRAG